MKANTSNPARAATVLAFLLATPIPGGWILLGLLLAYTRKDSNRG